VDTLVQVIVRVSFAYEISIPMAPSTGRRPAEALVSSRPHQPSKQMMTVMEIKTMGTS